MVLKSNERTNFQAGVAIPDAQQRKCAQTLARGDEGKTPGAGLRHCRFTLRRKQLLDVDAKYSSVKDLLDCLAIAGVIRGDKEGQITLEVNQEKIKRGEFEQTIIEVIA
jgi:sulfur carrier protein ThiS